MHEKPAHRGATAGLSNAFWQVSEERYAPTVAALQARSIERRHGLTPAVAAAVAALAYTLPEHWGVTR